MLFVFSFGYSQKIKDSLEQELTGVGKGREQVDLLNELGFIYTENNNPKAKSYLNRAERIAQQLNYDKGLADAKSNKGQYYFINEEYALSADALIGSIPYYEGLEDSVGLSNVYKSIGIIDFYIRDFQSSRTNFERAEQYINSKTNYPFIGDLLLNTSAVLTELGQPLKAFELSGKAIDLFEKNKDTTRIQAANYFLGSALLGVKNYDDAIVAFNRSLQNENNSPWFKELSQAKLILCYIEKDDLDKAEVYVDEILIDLLKEKDSYRQFLEFKAVSEFYSKKGNYEEAWKYANQFIDLKEHYKYSHDQEQLVNIRDKYEIEFREKENIILRNEAIVRDSKLRNQQIFIWVSSFLVLVILWLLWVTYDLYKRKRKSNINLRNNQRILNENNRNLASINEQKNNLFSIVAHDVKSPVSAIMASVNLLRTSRDKLSDRDIDYLIVELGKQAENLYDLIESVLTWARSQMDGYTFSNKHFNVSHLLEKVDDIYTLEIEKKNIAITCTIPKDVYINGDEKAIEVIVRNLIYNAIKFTDARGKIEYAYSEDEKFAHIHINDSGIGISQENIEKIFKKKQRVTIKGTANESGNGIGLILCSEIARKMGGMITVDSELGVGSTFTLSIPKQ